MQDRNPQQAFIEPAFHIIDSGSDVEQVVIQLRDLLRVDHVVYHSSKLGTSPSRDPYIRLTYPATWIKRYLLMNYVDVDPVLREGFLRVVPFAWSELVIGSQAEGQMLMDALAHGVGPNGFSIPVRSKQGHRGLFSISHAATPEQWRLFCDENVKDLVEIANRLHKRVIKERFGELGPQLSLREVECLMWSARGKDTRDISLILDLSFHTVRDYLKSARFKLNSSTITQAVREAMHIGLISDSNEGGLR